MSVQCCEEMERACSLNCREHDSVYECPDVLVSYTAKFDEFGLIVHDGGTSSISIGYCPWCGNSLPASKRERWFDELEARGIDPHGDSVPPEFRTDAWFRNDRNPPNQQ